MSGDEPRQSRADMPATKRPRRRTAGLGAMALVFVNGIVLTVASYLLLDLFITRMIENDARMLREDIARMVDTRLEKVEMDIETLATALALAPDTGSAVERLRKRVAQRGPGPMMMALWLPQGGQGQILYQRSGVLPMSPADLAREAGTSAGDKITVNPVLSAPENRQVRDIGQQTLSETYRPIMVTTPVVRQTGEHGTLSILLAAPELVDVGWLEQRQSVSGVKLTLTSNNTPVYDYSFLGTGDQSLLARAPDTITVDPVSFGRAFHAVFIIRENNQVLLLRGVPFMLLVAGVLLTVLGTSHVRNNHKQALRLAAMNRVLATKNMELNSQISERERLNMALRKTERENRAIIDAVTDIIFEVDVKGNILFINEPWHKITGFAVEQAQGWNLFDVLYRDDQDRERQEFDRLVRGQKAAYRSVARLRTAEERYRMVEMGFSMLRMDENRNLRVVGTITDIEERRQAEAALTEAEQKYRTIWENVASGIYQMTPEGHLLTANPALAYIFGYESISQMLDHVQDAHRQLYASVKDRQAMIRELMAEGQIAQAEVEGVRADKTKFWIAESVRAVKDKDGNVLYFEGSIDDITRRKEAEFRLRDAMLASDLANRSKTEFLANMSHELRTPLNAIIGFSEIIKDEAFGPIGQKQYHDYAKDIYESGKGLLSIINTILDVAKIEAGERQLNENVLDVKTVMMGVVDLLGPKAVENKQDINIIVPDGFAYLVAEELAVKQILVNLLSNAIKFTPEGGRISVMAEIDPSGEMRLAVTDTGVGLDKVEIERVMAPFGHTTDSFSRQSTGAGLGLTLIHSLIRLHGGRFELFSQKGIGTTAAVVFPPERVRKRG